MRKIKLYIATSLDGKIARPDGGLDWLPDPADDAYKHEDYGYEELVNSIDTTLMGYKTYEVCLNLGEWHYKDQTTYVFSRDPKREMIPEAQLVTTDPVEFTRNLKQTDGKDIWLIGGGEIISLLHDAGLIDEYILAYIPVILGEGIELFPGIKKQENLKLTRHKVFESDIIMMYFEKK